MSKVSVCLIKGSNMTSYSDHKELKLNVLETGVRILDSCTIDECSRKVLAVEHSLKLSISETS